MARPAVTAKVVGTDILIEALNELGTVKMRNFLRRGMRKAASRLCTIAKSNLKCMGAVHTGALLKSLGYKVYTNRSKGVGAVIGPRKNAAQGWRAAMGAEYAKKAKALEARGGGTSAFHKAVARIARKHGHTMALARVLAGNAPNKYAHLVEFGHRIAAGGRLPKAPSARLLRAARKNATGGVLRKREARALLNAGTVPAKPFMRQAWSIGQMEARMTVEAELRKGIEAHAASRGDGGTEPQQQEGD